MKLLDQFVVKTLPFVPKPIVAMLSKPYIAGDNLDAAVNCVKKLQAKEFRVTIDLLGEFVTNFDQARQSLAGYIEVVHAIEQHKLDANISVKPTFFGLLLDRERSGILIEELMQEVAAKGNFMRLDMEDSPCTDLTIELYNHFRKKYNSHVGIVLQAYLRRTLKDIEDITHMGRAHFRLCKGIYVEPENIAFQGYDEVRKNFLDSLKAMFDRGAYVGIATHDEYLVEEAEKMVRERGLGPDHYEFQMLLGVRETLRDQIHNAGHQLRIYVPFGRQWYGYSMRRLKENPSLAGTMFKAIIFKK